MLASVCPADIVATLRAAHGADPKGTRMGVDVIAGAAGDMSQLGIYESYKVKHQVRGPAAWPSLARSEHSYTAVGLQQIDPLNVQGRLWSC